MLTVLAPLFFCAAALQDPERPPTFQDAAAGLRQQLDAALTELAALRERIAAETVPMTRRLGELESELLDAREEYQRLARTLDGRTLDLTTLRGELQAREQEISYVSGLLGDYAREFDARLHVAERQRFRADLDAARLAAENPALEAAAAFAEQERLVASALARLDGALGGARFAGAAVDASGTVRQGTFLQVGPSVLFRSADGAIVGVAAQRVDSSEPAVLSFDDPLVAAAAAAAIMGTGATMPFDPTLGNAHKVAAIEQTFVEHFLAGGPVMWPILGVASIALLVALGKWIQLTLTFKPSRRRLQRVLEAVQRGDREAVRREAGAIRGPAGRMLVAGAENLDRPRELIEEVMYENLLATKLRLNRMLPFIAITSSSAPLLGLLGTVTGIMNTFTLMTVFGTGDVKTLSSGISEALITTEYGLYVAIPSLLLYAFLSRQAKGILDGMEKAAVAFANQVGKSQADAQPARAAA